MTIRPPEPGRAGKVEGVVSALSARYDNRSSEKGRPGRPPGPGRLPGRKEQAARSRCVRASRTAPPRPPHPRPSSPENGPAAVHGSQGFSAGGEAAERRRRMTPEPKDRFSRLPLRPKNTPPRRVSRAVTPMPSLVLDNREPDQQVAARRGWPPSREVRRRRAQEESRLGLHVPSGSPEPPPRRNLFLRFHPKRRLTILLRSGGKDSTHLYK